MLSDKPDAKQMLATISEKLLLQGHQIELRLGGNSMYPFLRSGDLAVIEPVEMTSVKTGDIILFKQEDRYIAHRVLACKADHLICKGDAMPHKDPPVSTDELLGRIRAYRRAKRHVELKSPLRQGANSFLALCSPYTPPLYRLLAKLKRQLTRII